MQQRVKAALRSQLIPLLALLVAMAAIAATRSYLAERQDALAGSVREAVELERQLSGVLAAVQQAESNQRGYLLTGERSYLDRYLVLRASVPDMLERIGASVGYPLSGLEALRAAAVERMADIDEVLRLYDEGRAVEAITLLKSGRGAEAMTRIDDLLSEMRRAQSAYLEAQFGAVRQIAVWQRFGSLAAALAILAIGVFGFLQMRLRLAAIAAAHQELQQANGALRQEMATREAAEAQVRQMQKMEAVGQLTGGIAHDFNNMLAVVTSALNLIQRKLARGETDIGDYVESAGDAVSRAATLTARLLAFSRQQPLSPEVVDVNRLVASVSDLLQRTLGEAVEIETVLAGGLWPTRSDVSQLENAVVNLAVNARDAMPGGGRLTIETANAWLDEAYAREHEEVQAGQYVMVAVTDTGSGMAPEVVARAFEPFFTTKPAGKGTGLGLSQVFGFLKQSGGHVKVYSEPGRGTTVKLYLPRHFGTAAEAPETVAAAPRQATPSELVLVVEDDPAVGRATVAALAELGYRTVEADGAAAALERLAADPAVDLLFTDIVMPGMDGRRLADAALARRPGLRVLFTTGFTRNAVVHNGVLDHGVAFLPKPFTIDQLARKLREVLDA